MLVNVYWAITNHCLGNNYHTHPVFNFDLPTHWDKSLSIYACKYLCCLLGVLMCAYKRAYICKYMIIINMLVFITTIQCMNAGLSIVSSLSEYLLMIMYLC